MASKESENNGVTGFEFRKPEHRTKWERFQNSLYNPTNHTVLGRTGKSWGQLLIFYTIFYIVLAALFAICMQGLIATLDDKEPKWKLDSSLIGTNPGLGFRPISSRTEEGSLIWYDTKNQTTIKKWVDLLDGFLSRYNANQTGMNFVNCDYDQRPQPGQVCTVDLNNFGPCSPKNSYGYNGSSPCVFLKLNKIYGWEPQYYTSPMDGMPDDLVNTINRLNGTNRTQVWISCNGEGPVDKEQLNGFNYYPTRGFPGYYYPYLNSDNYLSPLIAVQIMNPKPNIMINIECRAWARNINYKGGNLHREGSVHFELMQDDK